MKNSKNNGKLYWDKNLCHRCQVSENQVTKRENQVQEIKMQLIWLLTLGFLIQESYKDQ